MSDEDLADLREWLASERASNAWLNERRQSSGSELAVEYVADLLAEVDRLRAENEFQAGVIGDQRTESGLYDQGVKDGWRAAKEDTIARLAAVNVKVKP